MASSQDWGWLLLPSLDQDAAMRNLVLAGKGEWLPSMIEWEGEKLTASGIPVVRERPASSPAAANRLISSALRPSPAKRGKAGESAARERDSGKGYMDRSDLGASKR